MLYICLFQVSFPVFQFRKVEEDTVRSLLDRLASQQVGLSGV